MYDLEVVIERSKGTRLHYWSVRTADGEIVINSNRGSKTRELALESYQSFVSLAASLPVRFPVHS